jgi:transcriptional regulator with XRE-family HTH domain
MITPILEAERRPTLPTPTSTTPRQVNAEALRKLVDEAGEFPTRIAFRAGITDQTMRFWLRGKRHVREPRIDSVTRLADAFTELLGRPIVIDDLLTDPNARHATEAPAKPKRRRAETPAEGSAAEAA